MACARCEDNWSVYFDTEPLADNAANHTLLLRCPDCGTLYEAYPEGRKPPIPLTQEEVLEAFPGAVLPRG